MYANVNAPPNVPAPQMVAGVMEAPAMAMPMQMPTYTAPAYGYGCHTPCHHGSAFLLIIVLFILLIIVGCSFPKC
ncbi:uncharacterized protein (TIGR01732 family) [Bacillus tianshenii]|uniref:Uncharacterized protein (TIGR01732 family) n=1 Tax=Sutcliffiella tianshenii TaxID=1463404 RepID=A0ABS2NW82_9BACI|nr:YjcZ family sporulation protein [Bacillus tianshenii]MBM7618500.1 uncharacterized protein (TIGR01732 family) [Bacillus tianshenii]